MEVIPAETPIYLLNLENLRLLLRNLFTPGSKNFYFKWLFFLENLRLHDRQVSNIFEGHVFVDVLEYIILLGAGIWLFVYMFW